MKRTLALLFMLGSTSSAQNSTFPYSERFDSVSVPALPAGWISTTNRSSAGDFVTTTSSPRSAPHAVLSTNATISQSLTSPSFDFSNRAPTKLDFYTARSSTHTAPLLVEASLDNGASFTITLSDTIRHPGTTGYVLTSVPFPSSIANQPAVRIRWRLIGNPAGGSTGTFRLDDVTIAAVSSWDLELTNLAASIQPHEGAAPTVQAVTLTATVKNVGTLPASGYSVQFFDDANGDAKLNPSERFATVAGSLLIPLDSAALIVTYSALTAGEHRFVAAILYAQDGNSANDTASTVVAVGAEKKAVIINEIMFDPLPGQNEWIEFFHRGPAPIDIVRWKFFDRPTASGVNAFSVTNNSHVVQPGDFIVVAAESTILSFFPHLISPPASTHLFILNRSAGFSLNNDGDDILLRDAAGGVIDRVSYSASWHHPDVTDTKGRSLERINPDLDSNDPRNWSTSPVIAGGTPGSQNSIHTTSLPSTASISINPNPFSPDGDGFEDFCAIRYNLPLTTSLIRITIFDVKGRLIRTLAHAELSGPQGEIVWDGLDDVRQRARICPYVVLIEAIDSHGGTVATTRGVVVVATRL